MRQPKKNPLYKSFGYAFEGISALEWCVCFILLGLILSLELVNTAGAVLVAAIMAAAAGLVIFIPKVWEILS